MTWNIDFKLWKTKSKQLKSEGCAIYLATKHPRTPWYAKALAALIIGYALSPIDLIPDFIPLVGYLDDLIIVSTGIVLLIKIIPGDILEECRAKVQSDFLNKKPKNWIAAIIIVLIWLWVIYLILSLIWPLKSFRSEGDPGMRLGKEAHFVNPKPNNCPPVGKGFIAITF